MVIENDEVVVARNERSGDRISEDPFIWNIRISKRIRGGNAVQVLNGGFQNSIGKKRVNGGKIGKAVKVEDSSIGNGEAEQAGKVVLAVVVDAKNLLADNSEGLRKITTESGLPHPTFIIHERY